MKLFPVFFLCLVLFGFSLMIHFFPQKNELLEAAIYRSLPLEIDGWKGEEKQPTPEEISALSSDTEFLKSHYKKGESAIYVSVVFSGMDMNNSIHRPERCLPAQGHFNLKGTPFQITVNEKKLPIRRILSKKNFRDRYGEIFKMEMITYYLFVGSHLVTNSHLGRTLIDIENKLLRGQSQRWAYISVTQAYGDLPWEGVYISLEQREEKLKLFLTKLAKKIIQFEKIGTN